MQLDQVPPTLARLQRRGQRRRHKEPHWRTRFRCHQRRRAEDRARRVFRARTTGRGVLTSGNPISPAHAFQTSR